MRILLQTADGELADAASSEELLSGTQFQVAKPSQPPWRDLMWLFSLLLHSTQAPHLLPEDGEP